MEITLDTRTVQFDPDSNKLWVQNSRLANFINKLLKQYDKGNYFFQTGEEAVFLVPQVDLNATRQALNLFFNGTLSLPKGKGEL